MRQFAYQTLALPSNNNKAIKNITIPEANFILPPSSLWLCVTGNGHSLMREQVILMKQANKTKQNTPNKTQSHEKISKWELWVSNIFPWARANLGCREILVSIINRFNNTKYTTGFGSLNTYVHLTAKFHWNPQNEDTSVRPVKLNGRSSALS